MVSYFTISIWKDMNNGFFSCWFLNFGLPMVLLAFSILQISYFYVSYRTERFKNEFLDHSSEDNSLLPVTSKLQRFDIAKIQAYFNRGVLKCKIPQTTYDRLLSFVEFLALFIHVVYAIRIMVTNDSRQLSIVWFAIYAFLLTIFILRFMIHNSVPLSRRHPDFFKYSLFWYHLLTLGDVYQLFGLLSNETIDQKLHYSIVDTILNVSSLMAAYLSRFQNNYSNTAYFTKNDARPCLEPLSSILLTLTFSWANPLFSLASSRPLQERDIGGLMKDDYAANAVSNFKSLLLEDCTQNLAYRLFKSFQNIFMLQFFCGITSSFFTLIPSVLLKQFLEYVSNPEEIKESYAWFMILLMFVMKLFESTLNAFSLYVGKRIDIRLRTLLINEIYCKILSKRLSGTQGSGSIMNLMSSDAYNIGFIISYLNTIPNSCLMITMAISLLYRNLGWSAFIGALVVILLIPINHRAAATIGSYQKIALKTSDKRISQLNEIFNNIRTIKIFAWESKFYNEVIDTRNSEISTLKRKSFFWSLQGLLSSITPTLVTFGAFFCYTVIEKKTLTTPIAFTSLTLFNLLRQPLIDLAAWSSDIYQASISLKRIEAFLNEPETEKYDTLDLSVSGPKKIGFENLSFSWGANTFKLQNLNIDFKLGKLNVIIGPTGSGKSSLLLALLGEMHLIGNGKVHLPGSTPRNFLEEHQDLVDSVSYCSQSAWLINDTIKNNIIYYSKFDPERYEAVLNVCGLKEDLKIISEDTEVGEGGVILSGGQKQRLSLARAVYSKSRYLLLDDCLSAVDPHTSFWIFENCLVGDLMKDRTCILVSHNISLTMSKADWVVILDQGQVTDQGAVSELVSREKLNPEMIFIMSNDENLETIEDKVVPQIVPSVNKLIQAESKNEGSIPLVIFKSYVRSIGKKSTWGLIFCLYFVSQTIFISQTLWLRKWTTTVVADHSVLYYILIYLAIGVAFSLMSTIRVFIVSLRGLNASNNLFKKAFNRVLTAKSRFFDTTPKGRIINRFAKDIQSVDQDLIRYGETTLMYIIHSISTIIMICFVTPKFLIFLVFITAAYFYIGKIYLTLSRELKRIDSITRSPIYSQFQETLSGVVTIRAFGDELRYMLQNLSKLDQNNKAYYYLWISNRWLSVRTDALGALILFFSGAFIILNVKQLDSGLAGLSLTYAMTFNSYVVALIRAYVSVEMAMNSVERLDEYLHLDEEAPYKLPTDSQIPKKWPELGAVQVRNLSLRYSRDLKPVIKNLNFNIRSNERVAIVGRTGAGKSTIISAFFRFLEADNGGQIIIDGIDIKQIGLTKLRSSISIIPQDPALFHGNIRSNLDPFNEYTNLEINTALQKVNFATSNDEEILSKKVEENGSNFSQGQKQLLCLARALLHNCKILLLDEATSSVDHKTDAKIQETLRNSFDNNTLITIAHRLNSIIDYDRVLVLDKGELIEYDSPAVLLKNHDSLFFKLCEKSGELSFLCEKANSSL